MHIPFLLGVNMSTVISFPTVAVHEYRQRIYLDGRQLELSISGSMESLIAVLGGFAEHLECASCATQLNRVLRVFAKWLELKPVLASLLADQIDALVLSLESSLDLDFASNAALPSDVAIYRKRLVQQIEYCQQIYLIELSLQEALRA